MEMPQNFSPKSFWERKEGTTGMIVLAVVAGAIFMKFAVISAFIIMMLQNTITMIILGCIVGGLIYVIADPRFRNLVWYMYKSAMRKITSVFIEIDPIGILKNYVSHLRDQAQNMYDQLGNLKGQMKKLQTTIETNNRNKDAAMKMASIAKKENKNNVLALKSREAGRLTESNETLQSLYVKMEIAYRVLSKMYESCQILIEDLQGEINVKEREYEAVKASYSAFKSAMKIVNGDKDKKEIFDQTMEYLADDYGKKMGEIENFMEISKGIIDGIDLQNGVYEAEAFKQLEAWEQKSDSLLLGNSKESLIAQAKDESDVLDLNDNIISPKKKEAKIVSKYLNN